MSIKTPDQKIKHLGEFLDRSTSLWPDRQAISDGKNSLTFRQLDTLSTRLANYLKINGIKPNDRVVIIAPKEVEVVVAIAGCWKAGATYVPLEPSHPIQRIEYLINDISPSFIILPASIKEKLDSLILDRIPSLLLRQLLDLSDALGLDGPLEAVSNRTLAYCMYTSGSTGEPKGVLIEHQNVMSFMNSINRQMCFDEHSVCLNTSAFNFDVSIEDVILPLYYGASVFIYSGLMMPSRFFEVLQNEKITHIVAIASTITLMAGDISEFHKTDLSHLKIILTGGEVLNVKAIQTWMDKVSGLQVYNAYGPTETTCLCVIYPIKKEPNRTEFYPIGSPLDEVDLLIVDGDYQVLPPNHEGELMIGGNQVMAGYWANPDLTNSRIRFINGKRYYGSGDICRIDADGICHYLGRKDDEVKILGYRINLNEIRGGLIKQTTIKDGIASVIEIQGQKCLVAAAVIQAEVSTKAGLQILQNLSKILPHYMMPIHLMLCTDFPTLTSAKTDVKTIVSKLKGEIHQNNTTIILQKEPWNFNRGEI